MGKNYVVDMFIKNLANNRKERSRAVDRSRYLVGGLQDRYYVRTFPFIWDHSILDRVREGAMADAVSFNILVDISS